MKGDTNKDHKNQIEKLKQELKDQEDEYEEQFDAQNKELERIKKWRADDLEMFNNNLKNLQDTNAKLENELALEKEKSEAKEARILELEDAASYTNFPQDLKEAQLKIAELEKQVQLLKGTTYSTPNLMKDYAMLITTQTVELEKWMAGNKDLAEQLIKADRKYKELKGEKTDLESTLETAFADLNKITSELNASKSLLEQTKADHTEDLENLSKTYKEALNQQEQQHDRIVDDLTENLNQVQDENLAKTVELGELKKDFKSLKEQKEKVEIKLKTTIQEEIKTSEEVLTLEVARMKNLKRKWEESIDSIRTPN